MNKILTCPEKDLPRMAGEILLPEHCNDRSHRFSAAHRDGCNKKRCFKCNKPYGEANIPLTWDNAMKWRDWAVDKYGWEAFIGALAEVTKYAWHGAKGYTSPEAYALAKAQPHHYIRAAMLRKENEK